MKNKASVLKGFILLIPKILLALLFLTAGVFTVPRLFHYEVYAVISQSMEPVYPVGSVIFSKQISPEQVQAGDCITYRYGKELVTHRVIEADGDKRIFMTKGDANRYMDDPVEYNWLAGRSSENYIPYMGYIAIWIHEKKSTMGLLLALITALCCLLLNGKFILEHV